MESEQRVPVRNGRHISRANLLTYIAAILLLIYMGALAGGAALRESVTLDEVAHIGAGVSYLQKFELRLNGEHPPLVKVLAAAPLVLRNTHADYNHISWTFSEKFFPAYIAEWIFGNHLIAKWNDESSVLLWARFPMLMLTLLLGWIVFAYARDLGGNWGGLLCLTAYVSTPAFITFGPLVLTDTAIAFFTLLTLWSFAALWNAPTGRNALLFGLCFTGALLSKFTAGLLFFAFAGVSLSLRWFPLQRQPVAKGEARAWRKLRWLYTRYGILCAALAVYIFYFVFSWHQTTDVAYLVGGHSPAWVPIRRLLMPPWLYLRGVGFVLLTSSRPTFLLGRSYSHGVWFYFPVVFFLKSPLGFLGLLASALGLGLWWRRRPARTEDTAIPRELQLHWRTLWVSLLIFLAFCLISRLDLSIRHFTLPMLLLILLLAPVPNLINRLWRVRPTTGMMTAGAIGVMAVCCLIGVARAYPFFMPYLNSFSFGHPAYELVNDSNVDWNQSLPEAQRFAIEHGLSKIKIDAYTFTELTSSIPKTEVWDCQQPTPEDSGTWVVISGSMILDGHNCAWLLQFPLQALAGGSMYAVHLPATIPEAGSPGGPPLPSDFRYIAGAPVDLRAFFLELNRHPEKLPAAIAEMQAKMAASRKATAKPSSPGATPQ